MKLVLALLDGGDELGPSLLAERLRQRLAVSRDRAPLARHLTGHLEVKLDPVGALCGTECLVRRQRRAGQADGTVGEVERVAVPLQ